MFLFLAWHFYGLLSVYDRHILTQNIIIIIIRAALFVLLLFLVFVLLLRLLLVDLSGKTDTTEVMSATVSEYVLHIKQQFTFCSGATA